MRWIGRLVAIVLLLVLAASVVVGGSAALGSETSRSAPVVLHLRFRPVGRFGDGHCGPIVSTSGRYALVSISSRSLYGCLSGFVLIDDLTGKRTVIRESGSTGLQAFGAPWIFLGHNGHEELYNFVTKKTYKCPAQCGPNGGDAIGYAVGSRWLETFIQQPESCGDGVHYGCGPITEYFYNIETGRFRYSSSTSSTTIADLNSRRLFHRVCPPLRVPPGARWATATAARPCPG